MGIWGVRTPRLPCLVSLHNGPFRATSRGTSVQWGPVKGPGVQVAGQVLPPPREEPQFGGLLQHLVIFSSQSSTSDPPRSYPVTPSPEFVATCHDGHVPGKFFSAQIFVVEARLL